MGRAMSNLFAGLFWSTTLRTPASHFAFRDSAHHTHGCSSHGRARELNIGMDSSWFASLEDAIRNSVAWDGHNPEDYEAQ